VARVDTILKCSADELEKMSDADIENHFSSILNITRPTLNKLKTSPILTRADAAPTRSFNPNKSAPSPEKQAKLERARLIAEKFGVDIKDLM